MDGERRCAALWKPGGCLKVGGVRPVPTLTGRMDRVRTEAMVPDDLEVLTPRGR